MEERTRAATAASMEHGCPVHDLGGEFRPFELEDPFDFYARARAEQPVFFSAELGYWVVTRYTDVHAIFKAPKVFSSENTQAPYKPRPAEVERVLEAGGFRAYSGLSARQPPEHTRLRGFIAKAFTPRRVATLEPQIRELAAGMIDRFPSAGRFDLVAALTAELPALVIFRLLGIPDEDVPRVKEWAASRVFLNFGDAPVAEQAGHAENLVRYWRYCLELIEARQASPQDDLPSDLVRIFEAGDQSISIDEMAGLVYGQLTAGHETTSALLATGIKELLAQRERWLELCERPELIPNAVEELLRIVTPVFAWKRKVKEPARIGDVDVPAGANVLLLLGSANHDDTVFPEPARIDLERQNARSHLAFGHGIHFCLGASLARLEAKVVLEELMRRLPDLELVPDQEFDYSANTTFRCPASVLVRRSGPADVVRRFTECDSDDVGLVGGKAASLGTLLQAGLPVPAGFAVTTTAYAAHLATDGLGERIVAALAGTDGDVTRLDAASAHVRRMIEEQPLAGEVAEAIGSAYAELGTDVPVAVRSSATAEDSADASFAGQQDTFLWVTGTDQVLRHVARCWASLYSARSIAYRRDKGIEHAGVEMGVAVQRMVPARAAGVAMTLNPANGDRSKVAIESAFGLGESVVSGTVTPDAFLVDKVMLDVVSTRLAAKATEIVADPDGGGVVEREVEPERREQPSLAPAEVKAVAALAKRAERHYGCPQDVEWAIDARVDPPAVVLLQSRPETVWANKPAGTRGGTSYTTGLGSLVDTLINPLAKRSNPGVDADR